MAVSWLTLAVQSAEGATSSLETVPLVGRLGNAAVSYVAYLVDLVWPLGRAVIYVFPLAGWPAWQEAVDTAADAATEKIEETAETAEEKLEGDA